MATGAVREKTQSSYDPLRERAKVLADALFERAKAIADVLAPDVPYDQEEAPTELQWLLLERVAMNLSPEAWDNFDAIMDLYHLRKKFAPVLADPSLPVLARYRRQLNNHLPDPSITPQSPEWERQQRRLMRGS